MIYHGFVLMVHKEHVGPTIFFNSSGLRGGGGWEGVSTISKMTRIFGNIVTGTAVFFLLFAVCLTLDIFEGYGKVSLKCI